MNENQNTDASPERPDTVIAAADRLQSSVLPWTLRKQLVTDIEVAEYLNVSISTIRRWRLHGGGPRWIRIGASIRYPSVDLEAYVAGLPSGGGTAHPKTN